MRADRLVAILLLLQHRGQVTAREVAAELEVSERTARRDLDALAVSGVPVYAQVGRGGGWRLAGGGRTDLSGLNAAEARALFVVAGPSSQATPEVKAALRKLIRALPEPFRDDAEAARAAVVIDPAPWDGFRGAEVAPRWLDTLQTAVIEGERVRLSYVARDGAPSVRVVHPLGIAAKGRTWYLIAGTEAGQRTFRIDRVADAEPTGDAVVRPPDFDLTAAWKLVVDRFEEERAPLVAHARADPAIVGHLRFQLGTRVRFGPPEPDGRVPLELRGHRVGSLAAELAGMGAGLEVIDPPELRAALAAIGAELVAAYA